MSRRETLIVPFELKAVGDGDERTFSGYGSVFGVEDSYGDVIVRGAFKKTLAEHKAKKQMPALLLQHGGMGLFGGSAMDGVPIGVWDEMYEDDHGLFARGRLLDVDTDRIVETHAAMKAGALRGLSIGFNVAPNGAKVDPETDIRTIREIKLWEVSLVTFPANDPARVMDVRSDEELPTEREFERYLREAGFTREQAKCINAKGYRQVRREAMPSGETCGELLALVNRRTAIFTGDPTHGRSDAAGSQDCHR